MQYLPPESQALKDIRVLLRMIVGEACPALATSNRQAALRVFCAIRAEVLLEIRDHLLARIAVDTQERMIVTDAI